MQTTTRKSLTCLACAFAISFCMGLSKADAGLVTFSDITQSTQTPGDPPNLYGVADTSFPNFLSFPSPSMFAATATGVGGVDVTDSLLSFKVETSDPLTFATAFNLTEDLSLSLFPALPGNLVNVFAGGFIKITEINDVAVAGPTIPFSLDETFDSSDLTNGNSATPSVGISVPLGAGVTAFEVSFDNRLIAVSEAGVSFIDKKRVDIEIETEMIPEPASLALAFLGLVGVLGARRLS